MLTVICCALQAFQEEFFYAWTYDRPKSPWYYVLCGLAFLGITLCTMFPLAPRPIKLVALYVSMTLIIVIFSVLLVRGLVAMTTWILLGRSLWIFPHLLSEVIIHSSIYSLRALQSVDQVGCSRRSMAALQPALP